MKSIRYKLGDYPGTFKTPQGDIVELFCQEYLLKHGDTADDITPIWSTKDSLFYVINYVEFKIREIRYDDPDFRGIDQLRNSNISNDRPTTGRISVELVYVEHHGELSCELHGYHELEPTTAIVRADRSKHDGRYHTRLRYFKRI